MNRRHRRSRSGHCGFWILLLLVCYAVMFLMLGLKAVLFHGQPGGAPAWFKGLAIAVNPATWLLCACGALIIAENLHRAELQASRIGLAVWQWSTEKVFGFIPECLFTRALALAATFVTVMSGLLLWNANGNRALVDTMSLGTVFVATLAAMATVVIEVVLAAQLSPNPVSLGVEDDRR